MNTTTTAPAPRRSDAELLGDACAAINRPRKATLTTADGWERGF